MAKINTTVGNVSIKIDTKRIDRNIKEAQKELNLAVRRDCTPFVPKGGSGDLRRSASFPEGVYGGVLEYNTDYAHYLYVGEKYGPNIPIIDETTGEITEWWSPPHKQPTGELLKYHTKGTGKEWFETAKSRFGDEWVRTVKKIAGRE